MTAAWMTSRVTCVLCALQCQVLPRDRDAAGAAAAVCE